MDDPLRILENEIKAAGHEVLVRHDAGVWFALVDGEGVASDPSPSRLEAELRTWWEGEAHG